MRARSRLLVPLLTVGGIALVVVLAILVAIGATDPIDRPVMEAVRSPGLDSVLTPLRYVTELGSTWAVTLVAVLTLAVGLAIGPWRHGVVGALTIAAASLLNSGLKVAFARTRPELLEPIVVEHGFSFPSGHAALGMVAYGVLGVLVSRSRLPKAVRVTTIMALAVLVVLIGLSRIWLGVHFPTDVLAGWTAGGVIVLLYASLTRAVSREPAAGAVDADPEAPRSDPPEPG